MRETELLVPASSLEVLKVAVIYGADAVYIGGEVYGLRAKAKNFSKEDMIEGIRFAHEHGVKVYVTANILAHNGDLEGVKEYFEELKEIKPDALIIADPAIFMLAKEICPDIERHISTQANNTNYGTYKFWHDLGAHRVVSARELSLEEIKEIRANIPDLLSSGIDSFKIEGRMKTALYVATVARTYRKAIDDCKESEEKYLANLDWYKEQISACTYRQFTTGFFYGKPSEESQIYDNNTYNIGYTYLGIAGPKNSEDYFEIEQRNKFSVGETIEIMKPNGDNIEVQVLGIKNEEGEDMESCPHPKQKLFIKLSVTPDEFDILRRKEA